MRRLYVVLIMTAAFGLPACASGGGKVSHVEYELGGTWGVWGGYRAAPVYLPVDAGPVSASELDFEATPLPEIPDDG